MSHNSGAKRQVIQIRYSESIFCWLINWCNLNTFLFKSSILWHIRCCIEWLVDAVNNVLLLFFVRFVEGGTAAIMPNMHRNSMISVRKSIAQKDVEIIANMGIMVSYQTRYYTQCHLISVKIAMHCVLWSDLRIIMYIVARYHSCVRSVKICRVSCLTLEEFFAVYIYLIVPC